MAQFLNKRVIRCEYATNTEHCVISGGHQCHYRCPEGCKQSGLCKKYKPENKFAITK